MKQPYLAPGNGGKTEKYEWTQTLAEVTVNIPLPIGITKKQLEVDYRATRLKVRSILALRIQPVPAMYLYDIIINDIDNYSFRLTSKAKELSLTVNFTKESKLTIVYGRLMMVS